MLCRVIPSIPSASATPHRRAKWFLQFTTTTIIITTILLLTMISAENATTNALTITTFNILAPVHRSMNDLNHRESEREDWWRPRAEGVADYISQKFSNSDVILLQEWWFDERFNTVFDSVMGDEFERVTERRPGPAGDGNEAGMTTTMRADGMCCLVRKKGKLELVKSEKVLTGPQRIAQIIQCRERRSDGEEGRNVLIANSHLSFPGNQDPIINNQRQANEAGIILDAISKASAEWGRDTKSFPENECLEVVCGDFNSDSCGLAAALVESPPHNFVNCASAAALGAQCDVGGKVNIGVTHRNHLGERVSVDHIFLRLAQRNEVEKKKSRFQINRRNGVTARQQPQPMRDRSAALAFGFLDAKGTRILSVRRGNIHLEGSTVLSDHRPVTAKIAWPRRPRPKMKEVLSSAIYMNVTRPLDPLEPAWGIVD